MQPPFTQAVRDLEGSEGSSAELAGDALLGSASDAASLDDDVVSWRLPRSWRAGILGLVALAACGGAAFALRGGREVPRVAEVLTAGAADASQKFNMYEAMAAKKWQASLRARPEKAGDVLEPLGRGLCVDPFGETFKGLRAEDADAWLEAEVSNDGRSVDCDQRCLEEPACTGYATLGSGSSGKCSIIKGSFPSAADGSSVGHCFWKHQFLQNTSDVATRASKAVPKIVWSFWQNMGKAVADGELPPVVALCIASWRHFNHDWEIRILNESTFLDWVKMSELPDNFDKLTEPHKADAIRTTLLPKYGGVWIDATIFMLQPLQQILPSEPQVRMFMNLDHVGEHDRKESRVNWTHNVEVWFIAAPAGDPLSEHVHDCLIKEQQIEGETWQPLAVTGLFSPAQVQQLSAQKIGPYLGYTACYLKSITDDAGIWQWYNGPAVQHVEVHDIGYRLDSIFGWNASAIVEALFGGTNETLVNEMKKPEVKMIKLRGEDRNAWSALSLEKLWCAPSTFHELLTSMGLKDDGIC